MSTVELRKNNGQRSLNSYAHVQISTLVRKPSAAASLKAYSGWHEAVLRGDCFLSTMATGTASTNASPDGVIKAYGNKCISILFMTLIWSTSSLIAQLSVPILVQQEPQKNWRSNVPGSWPKSRRVQYQNTCERRCIGQPLAIYFDCGSTPRHHPGTGIDS